MHISLLIQMIKNVWMIDLFLTNMQRFTSQDVNWWTRIVWITCGLLWCFYQLFGLILTAPIHWRAIDVMLNFSKSVLMEKHTHLHLGWHLGLQKIYFWVNCSFEYNGGIQKKLNKICIALKLIMCRLLQCTAVLVPDLWPECHHHLQINLFCFN